MQIIVPRWNLPPTYSIDYQIEELRKFLRPMNPTLIRHPGVREEHSVTALPADIQRSSTRPTATMVQQRRCSLVESAKISGRSEL